MTTQTATDLVKKLVETFEKHLDSYWSTKNETELRREFLDRFFSALGWDVANEKGYDEAGKEVVHEYSVDVAGQQKKADYAFRVGRGNKFEFLVEAKKPSVKIESNREAAFQIRRYGWSAKLPINILTDFEHFAVYDCRIKPNFGDKASVGRIMLIHYKDYLDHWADLMALFSPEAVRSGALAEYAVGQKGKKGTADVDDAFLQEIERWRELLAKNVALRNRDVDIAGLNYAVQMTIDRIVFLRICEEREIEPENQLKEIADRDGVYQGLCELFARADAKYNSGLFHFKHEPGVASYPDKLTPSLEIDDKALRDIISNLYYPKSPYAFLYIPADILGQVYERFLGKVIRLTQGHHAKVEEKPEVRKAGGVYYTPTYVVEYIVRKTVGELVANKTPKEVAGLRIVDPACGSGTFLLGVYQYLLDWHLAWYINNGPDAAVKGKSIVNVGDGYRLTTAKKKEILLNNVFGVDIDTQAVEVTKLSLLLKVLENASGQLDLGMDRVLPDLGNNIKCGNSLIGSDYFEEQLPMGDDERVRVNPFDWQQEFQNVFSRGGFHAIVGNPPYIRVRVYKEFYPSEAKYLEAHYECATHVWDIYLLFFERAVQMLRPNGLASFIIPIQTLHQPNCGSLRRLLLSKTSIGSIADLSKLRVFQDAVVKNCIMVAAKRTPATDSEVAIYYPDQPEDLEQGPVRQWPQALILKNPALSMKLDLLSPLQILLEKLEAKSWRLEELCYVTFGLRSSAKGVGQGGKERLITDDAKAPSAKPYVEGRDIKRYALNPTGRYIRYLPAEMYSPRVPELFETPKIVSQSMLSKKRIIATLDDGHFYAEQSLVCIVPHGVVTPVSEMGGGLPLEFILGVINSRLESFYFGTKIIDHSLGGGLIHATPGSQAKLLIPKAPETIVTKVVARVKQILSLQKKLNSTQNPQQLERISREIAEADHAIDDLIYDAFGLTSEEREIVQI